MQNLLLRGKQNEFFDDASIRFLEGFESENPLEVFIKRKKGDLYFHLLDRSSVEYLLTD